MAATLFIQNITRKRCTSHSVGWQFVDHIFSYTFSIYLTWTVPLLCFYDMILKDLKLQEVRYVFAPFKFVKSWDAVEVLPFAL